MGNFYVDDSVHDDGGFILCTCVYAPDEIEQLILDRMKSYGLNPEEFEYKSSANYSKQPELTKFRSELKDLVQKYCKYGIVILPRDDRQNVGRECLLAIEQFANANSKVDPSVSIYIDQGMFPSRNAANEIFGNLKLKNAKLYAEQDSKKIRGIQLADLVAHMASIQLKSAMGLITKMVKAGENSGYDPEMEIELSFEMFGTLRYSIFNEGNNNSQTGDQAVDATLTVGQSGLFISKTCSSDLVDWANSTFGTIYLGCIH